MRQWAFTSLIMLALIIAVACSGPVRHAVTGAPATVVSGTASADAQQTAVPTVVETEVPAPTPAPTQAATRTPEATAVATAAPTKTTKPTPSPAPIKPTPVPTGVGGSTRDPLWDVAIKTLDGGVVGVVTSDTLNVRAAPQVNAAVVGTLYGGHPVTTYGVVDGDAVEGNTTWYRVANDAYVSGVFIDPFVAEKPTSANSGHWVDVNTNTGYLVAYDGKTPVFAAIIITGKPGHETPVGEFKVNRRVADETMDAATLGIPKTSPDYYRLEHVKWTQYFTNQGDALHTNYWSQPWQYGGTGSHGCVNLQEPDAKFLWDFLSLGSVVSVHG